MYSAERQERDVLCLACLDSQPSNVSEMRCLFLLKTTILLMSVFAVCVKHIYRFHLTRTLVKHSKQSVILGLINEISRTPEPQVQFLDILMSVLAVCFKHLISLTFTRTLAKTAGNPFILRLINEISMTLEPQIQFLEFYQVNNFTKHHSYETKQTAIQLSPRCFYKGI